MDLVTYALIKRYAKDYTDSHIPTVPPQRTYVLNEIAEFADNTATTAELYDTLKTTMHPGDVCTGYLTVSDGPMPSSAVEIFAYCPKEYVTDGVTVYARVYIIMSNKSTYPYVWFYNNGSWDSIMLLHNSDKEFYMKSSTADSNKCFKITVNDAGVLSANEIIWE